MKKLYDINKTDEKRFKMLVDDEARKHSSKRKIAATLSKVEREYIKEIADKLVFDYFKGSQSVLCIGCRHEAELALFENRGLQATGIDPAVGTSKIKQAPAEKMSEYFSEKDFDFVYASHSLEHVVIPEKVISDVRRIANLGCYIVLPMIERDTPKVGHPTLFDICKQNQKSSKEELINSIKEDFKLFEPYKVEDIFFSNECEPEFHICLSWNNKGS